MRQKAIYLCFVCFCILLYAKTAGAETQYVSDKMKITFRSGPGSDRKIISLLDSGQSLEVVQKEAEWSLVKLPNGKEGYVLHRYLTTIVPCDMRLEKLEKVHQELIARAETLTKEGNRLKTENKKLNETLLSTQTDLEKSRADFDGLTRDSADYLKLKSTHKTTTSHLSKQTKRADDLEKELNLVLKKRNIMWFLSGGILLLLGVIIGLITRPKKRSSSLL